MRILAMGVLLAMAGSAAATPLTGAQKIEIDAAVARILKASDVPSASIAIVTDGQLDYARGYGDQRLDGTPPTATTRYPIASISKQFTAAAILLLAEDGKLSLEDKVAKYLPTLTDAGKVTIRELLGHTSGYRDYWPQDFRFEAMTHPTTPQAIVDRWARAPLDYPPGTKWQYSNTGYVVAGLIAEIVAKEPLHDFEQRRLFRPLGMAVVLGTSGLAPGDAHGTSRYALGPVHPTPGEQEGWVFAAGDLALTPGELAKWNIARLDRRLLKATSWQLQETNVAPADAGLEYGLGVFLDKSHSHARVQHDGALTAFLASNRVYPDERAAITVFINAGFSNSQDAIADAIEDVLFNSASDVANARAVYEMLRSGKIDRQRFTENGNFYFTPQALADYQASLSALGELQDIVRTKPPSLRGGLTSERYLLRFASRRLLAVVRAEPDTGRVEQFALYPYSD